MLKCGLRRVLLAGGDGGVSIYHWSREMRNVQPVSNSLNGGRSIMCDDIGNIWHGALSLRYSQEIRP